MNIFRSALCTALILFTVSISQAEEVTLPDTLATHHGDLVLNGSGVRTKFFLSLYVGGLYLKEKQNDSETVIKSDEPMAIRLHIISSMITSQKMENAVREGFDKATGGQIEPIRDRIEQFIAVFKEEIKEDDVYDIVCTPRRGVAIVKNSKLHSIINGLDFKQALFAIWLGEKPAQESLKKEMLGL